MLGFLFKVGTVAAVVAGIGGFIYLRRGSLPSLPPPTQWLGIARQTAREVDFKVVAQNLSTSLDNLVTHPDKNSPVVLGVKITNESIGKVVDVIQSLPPEQINEIKQAICAPLPAEQ